MVDYLDSHAQVGIVGAQLLNPDQTYQGSCANFPTLLGEVLLLTGLARLVYGPTYPSPPSEKCTVERSVDWVCGACLMVRRAAAEAVGPLDEEYFMYTEETDWCFRMKGVGWGVAFLPSAQTIHRTGGSSHRVPERRRTQVYRSKWLFMRKHRGFLTAASFRALVRAISVIKLGVWLWMAIGPGPQRRELARGNVISYRFLLAHF
jgi:GT2 family glycosyltransferase